MKKLLFAVAALVLAATPAAAQQSASAQTQPAAQQSAVQPGMPSIFVSQDEIRQKVAANEAALGNTQVGNQSWWYLVAAIAVGVIIASLLL
jgi:curli biogenesis system outer membrane secretion channel CsgG